MSLANTRDLTDVQWRILQDLIPEPMHRKDGRGRPWKDRRAVLNGILWCCAPVLLSRALSVSSDLPQTVSAMGLPVFSQDSRL